MGVIELRVTVRIENAEELQAFVRQAIAEAVSEALWRGATKERVVVTDALVEPPAPVEKPILPKPDAKPASVAGNVRYTEERVIALAQLKTAGKSWKQIHGELNKMPGSAIASADSVMVKWYDLRKSGRLDELLKPAAVPIAAKAAGVVKVSYETARHWAGERGLVGGADELNMAKVNAKRAALGLAAFELTTRCGLNLP